VSWRVNGQMSTCADVKVGGGTKDGQACEVQGHGVCTCAQEGGWTALHFM
jgi:hypothetical protein